MSKRDRASSFLREVNLPRRIHPALVPGVSVDDLRIHFRIDRPIVVGVGGVIIAFVVWGVMSPDQVLALSTSVLHWVMVNLGWVFTTLAVVAAVVLVLLAVSRYGAIPLGRDGEKPEYSTLSWAAMLFAAGIGIGIIFFGPFEPLTYYLSPRPGAYEPETQRAVLGALSQSALHWGINAWAIYAVVGLAVGYVSYRRGRVPLMSSILTPLWGTRPVASRLIDAMAIVATLFGTAASLGIGALQISHGVEVVTGWSPAGNALAIGIIVVLTVGTIFSAVSGVNKGIQWLSNINLVLAVGLALFFFIVGPTAFLANMIPAVIVDYVGSMPQMLAANMGQGEDMQEFLSSWTTFYWAWWVSWSPFVGVFVAKISRGRTIRQFIFGVLFIPSTIIILAFSILGGTTIWLQRSTGDIAPGGKLPAPEQIVFTVLDHLPGGHLVAPLLIVMLAVFFITTADSASLVNSQLSQQGNPKPRRMVTAFWAVCMAGIAVVILLTGSSNALQGLQNLITITALPFAVVLVAMMVALFKELRHDPQSIRTTFQQQAIAKAVVRGVREHGDNFTLAIEPTHDDDYAVGSHFDADNEQVMDWYVAPADPPDESHPGT
ncbi:BCCT family transporter [Corynebacterium uberis]|uniref:BCCT family transporter n=1 Tax=Corynebacterium TaxID=1716 RepID=UPI001D0B8D2D|nr:MULTISPECIES: BCCT family transporter [Corynebacterium]MCZ9308922.1 BCCT family transporter [Corynebacterium sp. c6VSa_13]UDL74605.1 BCCT family transporter [Corynebacterium uberis]UDL76561.1 BCCT family transporter [Corynebacterium uberis]UDL78774.1 BCCT family transporter [Corynebacterium uberis]UDL81052.1 BCCT family transporter [Corynebacterium uberis]